MSRILRFPRDESGATATEYGLIAAGISVAIIAVGRPLGGLFDLARQLWRRRSACSIAPRAPLIVAFCIRLRPSRRRFAGIVLRAAGRKRRVWQQQLPDPLHVGARFAGAFGHRAIMALNGDPR